MLGVSSVRSPRCRCAYARADLSGRPPMLLGVDWLVACCCSFAGTRTYCMSVCMQVGHDHCRGPVVSVLRRAQKFGLGPRVRVEGRAATTVFLPSFRCVRGNAARTCWTCALNVMSRCPSVQPASRSSHPPVQSTKQPTKRTNVLTVRLFDGYQAVGERHPLHPTLRGVGAAALAQFHCCRVGDGADQTTEHRRNDGIRVPGPNGHQEVQGGWTREYCGVATP